ncbi:MAG TPA: DUF5329 family protein [Thermoanaerobaculia bacterium]|nr:DUF5329 family protein [Thermoanaerobaculia bacterium]
MRLRARALAILLVASSLAGAASGATRPVAEQAKIDLLLEAVRGSDAVFIRNGKEHSGPKAASHLRRKLAFAGGRVQTARDFITGIATRSEETGEPYRLRLPEGRVRPLAEWLTERLAEIEKR